MFQYHSEPISILESALYRTTTTIIQTKDMVLLVDPNWLPKEVELIQQIIKGTLNDRPLYLLFTHSDFDHIIAYRAFPTAKIIASKSLIENPDWEKELTAIYDFDEQFYITRNYEIQYPFEADVVVERDGQSFELGQTKLHFYLAPGHKHDSIFTIVEPVGAFIAGDYLSNIEFPFVNDSFKAYENTLEKVENILIKHSLKLMIPGHGDVCFDSRSVLERQMDALHYIRMLKKSIRLDQDFGDALWKKYPFKKALLEEHNNNIALLKKEMSIY